MTSNIQNRCKVSQIPSLVSQHDLSSNHVFHGGSLRNKRWSERQLFYGAVSPSPWRPSPPLCPRSWFHRRACSRLAIGDYYERRNSNSPKGSTTKRGRGQLTQSHFAANDSRMLLRVGYGRYGYHPVEHRSPEVRAWKNKTKKKRKKTNENNQQEFIFRKLFRFVISIKGYVEGGVRA